MSLTGKSPRGYVLDPTNTHVSYWTDNGAYYSYHKDSAEISFADQITEIAKHIRTEQLPITFLQLDSFWYARGVRNGMKVLRCSCILWQSMLTLRIMNR